MDDIPHAQKVEAFMSASGPWDRGFRKNQFDKSYLLAAGDTFSKYKLDYSVNPDGIDLYWILRQDLTALGLLMEMALHWNKLEARYLDNEQDLKFLFPDHWVWDILQKGKDELDFRVQKGSFYVRSPKVIQHLPAINVITAAHNHLCQNIGVYAPIFKHFVETFCEESKGMLQTLMVNYVPSPRLTIMTANEQSGSENNEAVQFVRMKAQKMRAEEALEKKAAEARKKQDAKLSTVQTMVDGYERDESETGSSKTETKEGTTPQISPELIDKKLYPILPLALAGSPNGSHSELASVEENSLKRDALGKSVDPAEEEVEKDDQMPKEFVKVNNVGRTGADASASQLELMDADMQQRSNLESDAPEIPGDKNAEAKSDGNGMKLRDRAAHTAKGWFKIKKDVPAASYGESKSAGESSTAQKRKRSDETGDMIGHKKPKGV